MYARIARTRERRPAAPKPTPYRSQSHRTSSLQKGEGVKKSKVEIERYRKRKQPMQNRIRNADGGADGVGVLVCGLADGPESDRESKTVEPRRTGSESTNAGSKYRTTHARYSELKGSHRVGPKRRGSVGYPGNCRNKICRQSARTHKL